MVGGYFIDETNEESLAQIYHQNGTRFHGRPIYIGENDAYGIWFDGESGTDAHWLIGPVQNLVDGNYNWAIMASNHDAECPVGSRIWLESANGRFNQNPNIIVTCNISSNVKTSNFFSPRAKHISNLTLPGQILYILITPNYH